MTADGSPRTLACPGCGAAIPPEAPAGAPVTCAFCGATYQVPDHLPAGGVSFHAGSVMVLGDVVGRDKVDIRVAGAINGSEPAQPEPPPKPAGSRGEVEARPPAHAPTAGSFVARLKRWLGRSSSSNRNS